MNTHGALWAALWVGSQVIVGFYAYHRGRQDSDADWMTWLNKLVKVKR